MKFDVISVDVSTPQSFCVGPWYRRRRRQWQLLCVVWVYIRLDKYCGTNGEVQAHCTNVTSTSMTANALMIPNTSCWHLMCENRMAKFWCCCPILMTWTLLLVPASGWCDKQQPRCLEGVAQARSRLWGLMDELQSKLDNLRVGQGQVVLTQSWNGRILFLCHEPSTEPLDGQVARAD